MTKSKIAGAKVLLMGGTGTGKTYALRSFVSAGITPFIIFTEPGMETVLDTAPKDETSKQLLAGKCPIHYHYIPPVVSNWDALASIGGNVNSLPYESLLKMTDANRSKYNQWILVVKANNDFVCDGCGEHFGDVQGWGTDRALVMDSLSGFSEMAIRLLIGGKVARAQSDWGIGQEMIRKVLDAWTTGTRCWFVMTAHTEREQDQVSGAIKVMVSTLGKALAPTIPRYFSDVIECVREGTKWSWNTASTNVETKARNVPIAAGIDPSFLGLVKRWKEKGGIIEQSSTTPTEGAPTQTKVQVTAEA